MSKYVPTEREQQFLDGLTELTKRTGVVIAGCGCCGSPFLVDDLPVTEDGRYTISEYSYQVSWEQP